MNHTLNNIEITDKRFEELSQNGGFYLEKYLICSPKKNKNLVNLAKINGLINIKELKSFLNDNRLSLSGEKNISDYFGDAVLAEDGLSYEGNIGIKFGVRLCFIPPAGFSLPVQINDVSREHRTFVQSPAAFDTESGRKLLESSKFSFPICSYEEDILDVKIKELINSNDNLNQELKCYVDKMAKTENFKHLVDNVLQIKKIPSLYTIYSYVNFIPSLGAPSERTVDDTMVVSPGDISRAFNDSKSQSRKLFVSFYRNDDRDPPNEEANNEDIVKAQQRRATNAISFIDYGEFSWDMKRRIVKENPQDKDGNECKNDFGKLFTIGGN
jgi:hypothetical protein